MTEPFDYLHSLELFGIKFGLHNISAIVEGLNHPEHAFRSVHIAGTNGKGSVTAMVTRALDEAGHLTGRYTSPHLLDLSERFVIDGLAVDRPSLAGAIDTVRQTVDALLVRGGPGGLDAQPTFFEVTTAVAFELFRSRGVQIGVCEVGLGGRLDATNVLTPEVTAVTSIGRDHEQYLGSTLEDIAREKAGILKPSIPIVVGRMPDAARVVIEESAQHCGAPIIHAYEGCDIVRPSGARRPDTLGAPVIFRLRTPAHDYGDIALALAGDHQVDNAVVAVRTLEALDARGVSVPRDAIVRGLATVRWPGRMERRRFADGREALLDAAHNPDGAAALAAVLSAEDEMCPLVFAAMRDKDAAGMLGQLAPVVSALIVTRSSNARSTDPSALAALARVAAPGLTIVEAASPAAALDAAWRLSRRITIAGSIFLLGDAMEAFERP